MKDKKIRVLCAVISLISVLTIIPIMFEFFIVHQDGIFNEYTYGIWGFEIYTNKEQAVNIVLGVLGLIALLWDLVYGAYALIDGRYRNLTWRIARYGYFYGIVMGLINFSFIASFLFYYSCCVSSVVFLIMVAAVTILKFFIIFIKDENSKNS